jgi:hypothetical protein
MGRCVPISALENDNKPVLDDSDEDELTRFERHGHAGGGVDVEDARWLVTVLDLDVVGQGNVTT